MGGEPGARRRASACAAVVDLGAFQR